MRKYGSPKIIRRINQHPAPLHFVKQVLQNDSFAAVERTTDVKTHTCHFDDENRRCKRSKTVRRCKFLSRYTTKFIIISIMKDTSRLDKITSKNAALFFRSGVNFALHSDLGLWYLHTTQSSSDRTEQNVFHRRFYVNLMVKITDGCLPKRTILLIVLQQFKANAA